MPGEESTVSRSANQRMTRHRTTPRPAAWALLAGLLAGPGLAHAAPGTASERPAAGSPAPAVHIEAWWAALESPDLDALIRKALSDNPSLGAAASRIAQADALVMQQQSALWPQLTLDARANAAPTESLGFQFGGVGGGGGTGSGEEPPAFFVNASATLNARWQLDLWGRTFLTQLAGRYESDAARGDVAAQQNAMALRVTEAYLQVLASRAQLGVLRAQIETNKNLLSVLEARFAGGEATALDVLQQRSQLAASQARLPQTEAIAEAQALVLAALLGQERLADGQVTQTAFPTVADVELDVDTAVAGRPDVQGAQKRVEAAAARTGAAWRGFLPTVALNANAGSQAFIMGDNMRDQWTYGAGATLSLPIFQGGRLVGAVQQSQAAEDIARRTLEAAELTARREILVARAQELQLSAQVDALKAQETASKATFDEARTRYLEGLATYQSVVTALAGAQNVELNRINAERARVAALVRRIQVSTALKTASE